VSCLFCCVLSSVSSSNQLRDYPSGRCIVLLPSLDSEGTYDLVNVMTNRVNLRPKVRYPYPTECWCDSVRSSTQQRMITVCCASQDHSVALTLDFWCCAFSCADSFMLGSRFKQEICIFSLHSHFRREIHTQ